MIAPVMRWAIEAERKNRNCTTEDGKENARVEPEVREQMRHVECWMNSVQGRETRRDVTDICENEDGTKVAPNMGAGGSHPQATLCPKFEESEKGESRKSVSQKRNNLWRKAKEKETEEKELMEEKEESEAKDDRSTRG